MRLMRLTQCSLRGVYQLSGGVASGRSATNRATPSSLLLFISIYQAAAPPVCPHSSISNYGYNFMSTLHFCNLKLLNILVYEFEVRFSEGEGEVEGEGEGEGESESSKVHSCSAVAGCTGRVQWYSSLIL